MARGLLLGSARLRPPFEKPNGSARIDKERTDIAEAFTDAASDRDRMNRGVACPKPLGESGVIPIAPLTCPARDVLATSSRLDPA
jgi:hypothetical protein